MTVRRIVATLALSATLVGGIATTAEAGPAVRKSHRVEAPTQPGQGVPVYFERLPGGRAFVELSNGAAWNLRPCRQEDSRTCFWDARTSGNGAGSSFVDIRGRHAFVRDIARH